jgi:hypothetical protein
VADQHSALTGACRAQERAGLGNLARARAGGLIWVPGLWRHKTLINAQSPDVLEEHLAARMTMSTSPRRYRGHGSFPRRQCACQQIVGVPIPASLCR